MSNVSAPEVAVVVPSYNHAHFIEATLRSIFAQTYRPLSLLVIDDGSKDESVAVIRRVLADCPFPAELIARENRGLTRTLNEGLSRTKGKYFAYLGSDDLWQPERIARGVATLESQPDAVMAFSHCYFIDGAGTRLDVSSRRSQHTSGFYFWKMMGGNVGIMSPTPLFRRSALELVRWNEQARLEDFELYLALALLGPFAFIDEPLASWRAHTTNTSASAEFMTRERIATIERMAARLALPEEQVEVLRRRVRFEEAGGLIGAGHRARAAAQTLQNVRAARSPEELLKRLGLLLLPRRLFELRRSVVARRASQK